MNKDRLGVEIKSILENEAFHIELSRELKDKILMNRKLTLKEKIINILNKEVEIPLIPLVATLSLITVLIGVPKDLIKKEEAFRTIDIGSSQIIIRDSMKVGVKDED